MAATIRTASKTTASLSDAKNLKAGPRCQEGCAEEMVAMIARPVSARTGSSSTRHRAHSSSAAAGSREPDDVVLKLSPRDPSTALEMKGKNPGSHRPPLQKKITSSRPSSVCGSVWYNVKPSRFSNDQRLP